VGEVGSSAMTMVSVIVTNHIKPHVVPAGSAKFFNCRDRDDLYDYENKKKWRGVWKNLTIIYSISPHDRMLV
jgi:hypothetical protein